MAKGDSEGFLERMTSPMEFYVGGKLISGEDKTGDKKNKDASKKRETKNASPTFAVKEKYPKR